MIYCTNFYFSCARFLVLILLLQFTHNANADLYDYSNGGPRKIRDTSHKTSCNLPDPTEDKTYAVNCEDGIALDVTSQPGESVPEYSSLTFICHPGYSGDKRNIFEATCVKNSWTPPISNCSKICKRLVPTGLNMECFRNGEVVDCDGPLLSGTTAHFHCKPGYSPRKLVNYDEIICKENGQWDKSLVECTSDCGTRYSNFNKSINLKGSSWQYNYFPWHAAIFNTTASSPKYICGGSIITPYLILTAASCLTIPSSLNAENAEVVVGKVLTNYNMQENEFQKAYKVREIYFYVLNKLLKFREGDIAILELHEDIESSFAVHPACVNWDYARYEVPENIEGMMASWGRGEKEDIKKDMGFNIEVFQSRAPKECSIPKNFIRVDKFCGFPKNAYASPIDVGAGFLVYKEETNLYYLHGVAMYSDKKSNTIIFTNIFKYLEWMLRIREQSRKRRTIERRTEKLRARSYCSNGYIFDPDDVCWKKKSNSILPCKKTCKKISFDNMKIKCTFEGEEINCAEDFIVGTKIELACPADYKPEYVPTSYSIVCQSNGVWDGTVFKCVPETEKACFLPSQTEDKQYAVNCDDGRFTDQIRSNTHTVGEFTLLSFQCKPGYFHKEGKGFQTFCFNGTWTPTIRACQKTCKALLLPNINMECYQNNERTECKGPFTVGTRIRTKCKPEYSPKYSVQYVDITCGEDGDWNGIPIECAAGCGKKHPQRFTEDIRYGTIPFYASFIDRRTSEKICAGTITSPFMIITASSCFQNATTKLLNNKNDYEVIVGHIIKTQIYALGTKSYSDDGFKKIYKIQEVYFFNNAKHVKQNLPGGIAIVELAEKISLNRNTLPACVDWSASKVFDSQGSFATLREDHYTENNKFIGSDATISDQNELDYKSCITRSKELTDKLTEDKFCIQMNGLPNKKEIGRGYFHEDSTGSSINHQYYVSGIMTNEQESEKTITVYTRLKPYMEWIEKISSQIDRRRVIEEGYSLVLKEDTICESHECWTLHPKHSVFTYKDLSLSCKGNILEKKYQFGCDLPYKNTNSIEYEIRCQSNEFEYSCENAKEGESVPDYTRLSYRCKKGYASYSMEESEPICQENRWIPRITSCKKICKKLKPENVVLKCTYGGKDVDCNQDLIENTKVSASCAHGYKSSQTTNRDIQCLPDGEWSAPLLHCEAECGRKGVKNLTALISGGRYATYGEFPWHVAVYDVSKRNQLICGGSILTQYIILSAAHCFYDTDLNRTKNFNNYRIAVGKITTKFETRDSEFTEMYEVKSIYNHENFYSFILRFQYDISIIEVKNKIIFSGQIHPVCLWYDKSIPLYHGATLQVAGWGKDETSRQSTALKVTEVSYISAKDCIKEAPSDIVDYISLDKFCAGETNESHVNEGDSGGGLVYEDKGSSLYYLTGLISFRATGTSSVALITNVDNYLDWISNLREDIHRKRQQFS